MLRLPIRELPAVVALPRNRPEDSMFAVYSNRLGCVGSIVVSLIGTAILAGAVWLLSR